MKIALTILITLLYFKYIKIDVDILGEATIGWPLAILFYLGTWIAAITCVILY